MKISAKGRGRYRIRIFHKGRHRERLFWGSKAEAEAFKARFALELEASAPEAITRAVPTFASFCATRYRPHAELHLKKASFYNTDHYLETLILFFGETKLTEIHDEDVDAFSRKRLKDGLRSISINNELRILRRVRNFAKERKVPIAEFKVKMLAQGESRVKAWEEAELAKLFKACAAVDQARAEEAKEEAARRAAMAWSKRHAKFGGAVLEKSKVLPLVLFLANTGCRKGESIQLKWQNVDLGRREVRIWPSEVWRPKNGKPREIPMSDSLFAWLSAESKNPRSEWVFCRTNGKPYQAFPRRAYEEAVKAAGLRGGPHTLRHTFASMFLARVPDLGVLAAILGHSDEAVTRLYTHMLPDRLAKARNVVSVGPEEGPATTKAKATWGSAEVVQKWGKKWGNPEGGEG